MSSGTDARRNAFSKSHWATGESRTVGYLDLRTDRLHPLVARSNPHFGHLFSRRSILEGWNGSLKTYCKLEARFVDRLHRVRLHVDLTMISRLLRAVVVEQLQT